MKRGTVVYKKPKGLLQIAATSTVLLSQPIGLKLQLKSKVLLVYLYWLIKQHEYTPANIKQHVAVIHCDAFSLS